ncbi:hypothetical protein [Streptomyces sp. NBC_00448]|uniref:hypothetical protein n=1 Tax=Streptomyces sp. NBC_00448 TaxID=2903652 RepID=UPI002E24D06A
MSSAGVDSVSVPYSRLTVLANPSISRAAAGRSGSVGGIGSPETFATGVLVAALAGTSAAGIAVLSHGPGRLEVSPVRVTAQLCRHRPYLG